MDRAACAEKGLRDVAKSKDYEFHPVAGIFPLLHGKDLEEMAASIKAGGLDDPIVLFEGKILDGRNRYRACKIAKVEPTTVHWDEQGSPIDFVLRANLHRRHLDQSQRAMAAATALSMFEAEAKERMEAGGVASKESRGKASEKAGEAFGVSHASVERAATVLESGDKTLIAAVQSGEVKVTDAAKVAELPKAEQRAAVKAVQAGEAKTVAAAAKGEAKPKPSGEGDWSVIESHIGKIVRTVDKLAAEFRIHDSAQHRAVLDSAQGLSNSLKAFRRKASN